MYKSNNECKGFRIRNMIANKRDREISRLDNIVYGTKWNEKKVKCRAIKKFMSLISRTPIKYYRVFSYILSSK